jgi:hypothetical protein
MGGLSTGELVGFSVFCAVLGLIALWYLLFASRWAGRALSWVLNRVLPGTRRIQIGAVHIAWLSTRVFVSRVTYVSKDIVFRVEEADVVFSWWWVRTHTTKYLGARATSISANRAVRIGIHVKGAEVSIVNHSKQYDWLDKVLQAREGGATMGVRLEPAAAEAVAVELPVLYQLSPAISVSFARLCVAIGNPSLGTMLTAACDSAKVRLLHGALSTTVCRGEHVDHRGRFPSGCSAGGTE